MGIIIRPSGGFFMKLNYLGSIAAVVAMTGCSAPTVEEGRERLDLLLSDGIEEDRQTKLQDRFARLSDKNKQAIDILENFDGDGAEQGPTTDLSSMLALALNRNPEIGQAAQQINKADAARLNAIYGYLPQVSAVANLNVINQSVVESDNDVFQVGEAEYQSLDYSIELSQPLFDMSRIYSIQLATTLRSSAEVEYIATVQGTMYEVFDTYMQALQAENDVRILRRRQSLLRQELQAQRDLTDEGLSRQNALRSLEIELADLSIDEAEESLTLASHVATLSRLTGSNVQGVTRVGSIPGGIAGTERRVSPEEAVASALERNPTVLRSLIDVTESDLRRKQALAADFSPILVAFARGVFEDREASRFGGGSVTQDYILGVRMVIPIFNASGAGYESIEAKVDVKDALLQYVNQKRIVSTDVNSTLVRMEELATARSRARASQRSNAQLVRQEIDLAESGESQPYLVAALQSRELASQAQATFYDLEYLRAWARLEYLTGQSLGENLR